MGIAETDGMDIIEAREKRGRVDANADIEKESSMTAAFPKESRS